MFHQEATVETIKFINENIVNFKLSKNYTKRTNTNTNKTRHGRERESSSHREILERFHVTITQTKTKNTMKISLLSRG